ncbi:XdhC family protein [Micromonospora humi]|uniref:Xanthine dehydrogenase accessory factor n=1 Tax=Micromonospora humi TaxID=745366 RepID=A0A1C5H357_9ACTN|nr:XdhC/CoxI family protein [Micromonospora humi]SCG39861.1 xanthine dehydrogenase accessory factor [Micromonospora humi]
MREHLADLLRWWLAGRPVAAATVTGTTGSAPRPVGATMLVGPDGTVLGSVSGGCVEAAVHAEAERVRETGPARALRYGAGREAATGVGLTCGGTIDVFVERLDRYTFPRLDDVVTAVTAGAPVAVLTCVAGPRHRLGRRMLLGPWGVHGSLGDARFDAAAVRDARAALAAARTEVRRHPGDLAVLVTAYPPPPRMILFGATDHVAALAAVGSQLGYRVTVCDARPAFATRRRFPSADEVVVDWPHRYLAAEVAGARVDERAVLIAMTHDPKFELPLLEVALAGPAAYVGAVGSRRAHAERLTRLRAAGVDDSALARLAGPAGLDLGASTPAETAVSIAAEVIAVRTGRAGGPLGRGLGRIHASSVAPSGVSPSCEPQSKERYDSWS